MSSAGAVQEIQSVRDSGVDLSPYSRLSVAAMQVGYETVLDTPLPEVAAGIVTSTIDGIVSGAVQQAIGSLSSIPVVGAVLGWLAFAVEDVAGAGDRERVHEAATVREVAERLSLLRPVGTGFGGRVVPADLLAAYLLPDGKEARPPPEGSARGAYPPTIGSAMLAWGGPAPGTREERGTSLVAWTNDQITTRFLYEAAARATGFPGPTVGQVIVFDAAARAIADSRRRRLTDGGATLWPVLLDCLRSSARVAPRAYWDWLASHAVTYDGKVDARGVAKRSALRVYENPVWAGAIRPWYDAVGELVRGWQLAVYPIYKQDRAQADQIRRDVEDEVRRLLRPAMPLVAPIRDAVRARARTARAVRAISLAGAGAAALAVAYPGAAARVASGAIGAARRVLW